MKNIVKILIVLIFQFSFSQNNEAIVTYKAYLNEKIDESSDVYKRIAKKGLEKVDFELLIKKESNVFKLKDNLTNSDSDVLIALAFSKFKQSVFYQVANKTFYFNNIFSPITPEKEFVISINDTISWEIQTESKIINNHLCYKAKKTIPIYGQKNKKSLEVIAWFCPEINIQSGPLFYNGLPGLIFELQEQHVTYIISNIKFGSIKKDLTSYKPKKGKIVTLEEYNQIIENRFRETKEYLDSN